MSVNSNLDDGFKLITYKKKNSNNNKRNNILPSCKESLDDVKPDWDKTLKRINDAFEDYLSSNIHTSFKALLTEGLLLLNKPNVSEIVCFGLGSLSDCIISRFQFSLLLYLKERFNVNVYLYDPVFTEFDIKVIEKFGCKVLDDNFEGKYTVKSDSTTIFYLPHCPKQLSNNLLWKNWGLHLSNCILIANSFRSIVEGNTSKSLVNNANYITTISPHTVELSIINEFKFFEIFNDTSIHIFPQNKLNLLPKDFWENAEEPVYNLDDLEFITKKIEKTLSI